MSTLRALRTGLLLAAQILIAAGTAHSQEFGSASFKAYAPAQGEARISNFSGLTVPRYSSLRSAPVNGRAGPSLDYPVRWRYSRAGLPVIVVRESQDWRKIRDPMGDEVWVRKDMLAAQRTVITTGRGEIRRDPDAQSPALATFEAGAVLAFGECGPDWCRVEAEGRRGHVARGLLWGADTLPAP